jgi:hypothetical protein
MMKNQLILLLLIIAITSCSKNTIKPSVVVTGNWQLLKSVGGIMGGDHPAQDKIIMQLHADSSCRFLKNDSVYYTGTFSVYQGKTYYGRDTLLVQFSNYGTPSIISVKNDTLVLDMQVMCAYWEVYTRQKPNQQ